MLRFEFRPFAGLGCRQIGLLLRSYAEGELPPAESRRVSDHLEGCRSCREELERCNALLSLLHNLPVEEPPSWLAADLQVRLAGPRARMRWSRAFAALPRRRLAAVAAVAASLSAMLLFQTRGVNAQEIARRATARWDSVRSYSAEFVSTGIYRGEPRRFVQRQFFRRPGHFRLDTAQDYALTTYVDPEQLQHYLPGGDWEGRGPLLIVRPRLQGQEALPFPFGAESGAGGNVNLEELFQRLRQGTQVTLSGEEELDGRVCHRLRMVTESPGGFHPETIDLWLDTETLLPCRVSWYRDLQNRIITVAQSLQVDPAVFPSDTFRANCPPGSFRVEGDIDPHVLALPRRRRPERGAAAAAAASDEAWRRGAALPFRVRMPLWLPPNAALVSVRHKTGHWLDAHWLLERRGGAGVVKLIAQYREDTPLLLLPEGARKVVLEQPEASVDANLVSGSTPYPFHVLQWTAGRSRFSLFGSGLAEQVFLRIARSFAASRPLPVDPDPVPVAVSSGGTDEGAHRSISDRPATLIPVGPPPPPQLSEGTPMMPELPDAVSLAAY